MIICLQLIDHHRCPSQGYLCCKWWRIHANDNAHHTLTHSTYIYIYSQTWLLLVKFELITFSYEISCTLIFWVVLFIYRVVRLDDWSIGRVTNSMSNHIFSKAMCDFQYHIKWSKENFVNVKHQV